jgi:hypothetical protein
MKGKTGTAQSPESAQCPTCNAAQSIVPSSRVMLMASSVSSAQPH